ncbi:MAG: hypothetical protein C4522_15885 [Desulfobacteraceae bacterium]|nr:MAG: hypothetical protein C4522_15885 [Desulfobacteraceae bacterium]
MGVRVSPSAPSKKSRVWQTAEIAKPFFYFDDRSGRLPSKKMIHSDIQFGEYRKIPSVKFNKKIIMIKPVRFFKIQFAKQWIFR